MQLFSVKLTDISKNKAKPRLDKCHTPQDIPFGTVLQDQKDIPPEQLKALGL
jgi:hypothetical protein